MKKTLVPCSYALRMLSIRRAWERGQVEGSITPQLVDTPVLPNYNTWLNHRFTHISSSAISAKSV